ncbi:ATP-binding cassette domain-containing protein [Corynebacterium kozikiae]|uniref:ATP-binding cassette domain-containing protein n=1 Tax=Corynebacterium kozikiae TaxID=2968469 RepID=UPI00211C9406|nr:ATP-binding cassette domain-containing protein [Corynebacterium sp. 76QC2CO]MCQ9344095.1 ATP-binding cassette domain-containing protein [Corynebacterium sp. 76QC2CO]
MSKANPSVPAIECKDLSITYSGNIVLDGFSMTVNPGRVHALLGRNGAGKSTCFRMILGLEDRGQGQITIMGEPRTRSSLNYIGASINGPAFYGRLSARDNIRIHAKLLNVSTDEIDAALSAVGLENTGKKKARSFSTGMKARLALATAMLGRPAILILDEPQNGLDPQGIADLRTLIRHWAQMGGTVLISSHQLGEVAKLTDDITILAGGRDVFSGSLEDFASPECLEERFLEVTQGGNNNDHSTSNIR